MNCLQARSEVFASALVTAPQRRRLPNDDNATSTDPDVAELRICHSSYLEGNTLKLPLILYYNKLNHNITKMDSSSVEKQPLLEDNSGPEPTLAELQQNVFKAQRAYMRAWSRTTSGKWHKRIIFGVTGLLFFFMIFCISVIAVDVWNEDDTPYSSGRVPLEAFIMSKCPDARDCLHDMVLPAMQNISHKVDFKLSYIGR